MSESQNIVCRACGTEKKAVNRWWRVIPTTDRKGQEYLRLVKPGMFLKSGGVDVCGQKCLQTLVDRWMEKGSLELKMWPERETKPVGLTEEVILGIESPAEEVKPQIEVVVEEPKEQEKTPEDLNPIPEDPENKE
jgi:hypothetical protein